MEVSNSLTVFFDDPFWVGVFERYCENRLEVSRVVFGSEPRDYEVYEFILRNYDRLEFSSPVAVEYHQRRKINPKRRKKEIRAETQEKGVGTKAQLAMKLQYESKKLERKKASKEYREEEEKRKFQLRQQKKKLKHSGH